MVPEWIGSIITMVFVVQERIESIITIGVHGPIVDLIEKNNGVHGPRVDLIGNYHDLHGPRVDLIENYHGFPGPRVDLDVEAPKTPKTLAQIYI